jgi:transketolase
MALAERFLRERYGTDVMDHRVFGICSDGDLMEGVSAEAASLAGHLGLGRIVYLYDDNRITIDGDTSLSFDTEDVEARFRAYGWHTTSVGDANDLGALTTAIESAVAETARPSLIRVRSIIGYPSPGKQGTAAAHGAPLGDDEVHATKEALGWDPDSRFVVDDAVREAFATGREQGARAYGEWSARFERWRAAQPEAALEWSRAWSGQPSPGMASALPVFDPEATPALATRVAGAIAMAAFATYLPTMVGGSADLVESTKTLLPDAGSFSRAAAGANVHWGVREHGMGAAVNGLALHGGIVKPFGSTFLVFADYMRPAIRLSALIGLPVVWVFTHDSVAVGEDGPTHQPIEHFAALRAIPGLIVLRPADANETVAAWRVAIEHRSGPVCLLLTRQNVPVLSPELVTDGVAKGGYVLRDTGGMPLDVVLVATGSEVSVALEAREQLRAERVGARVVSMPSWELFVAQDGEYRADVIPPGVPVVSVEAGIEQGWGRFADVSVSIERFGASAPGAEVLSRLGVTAESAVAAARQVLSRRG